MPRQPSALYRGLEPLVHALWPLFLGWSVVTAILWWTGDTWVEHLGNAGLRAAVAFLIRSADAAWLLLAALNIYLELAAREGIARARTVALVVFGIAAIIAWASVATAYPLGSVVYTSHLGTRLGPVPIGWLLLWFVVGLGGKAFVGSLWPRLSHGALSVAVGFVALFTSLNLDPLAVKLRLYWFWYAAGTATPVAPLARNFATWFVVASALAWFARDQNVAATRTPASRASFTFIILNVVFLSGHLQSLLGR